MRSTFWICISIILAVVIHGMMNRYEGHTMNEYASVWVIDRITGTARICSASGCRTTGDEKIAATLPANWKIVGQPPAQQ